MSDIIETYDSEGKLISRIDYRTDDEVLEQNLSRIKLDLYNALNEPVMYQGFPLQIRTDDRINLDGAATDAMAVKSGIGSWDSGFVWVMADDSVLAVPTPDDQIKLGQFAKQSFLNLMKRKWAAKTAIKEAINNKDRDAADAVVL